MKQMIFALMMTVAFSGIVVAQSNNSSDAASGKSKKTQMICPVTGEKASKNYSYEYKGETYNFCCTKCKAKFIKNPEKYLKGSKKGHEGHKHNGEMKGEMKGHEGHKHSGEMKMKTKIKGKASVMNVVNANCPISGKKVKDDGGTYMYKGKTYGFCCPGCIDKFKEDPEKYIKKI